MRVLGNGMIGSWGCRGFDERPEGQYQGDRDDQDKRNGDIL